MTENPEQIEEINNPSDLDEFERSILEWSNQEDLKECENELKEVCNRLNKK